MAQAADRPAVCGQSTVPFKYQKPFEDLSGKLPVRDYLDAVVECVGFATPAVPIVPSVWLESDSRRYAEFIGRTKYSWLVLPAQTQYYGFDRIERALIGAEVAAAFADRSSMPDTLLVARALGELRRRYDASAVAKLTADVGAGRRADVYVGHDGKHRMTLTIQLHECSTGGNCKLLKQQDWRNLAFSDELPPFRVVNRMQGDIRLKMLGVDARAAPAQPPVPSAKSLLGMTPAMLMSPDRVSDARVASLMATLVPQYSGIARERLNLIALREWLHAPPTPDSRFYAALAAFELQRRPFALKLLEKIERPDAQTLREVLNGNLPEAQQNMTRVPAGLPRLLLAFRLQDLAGSYGKELKFDFAPVAEVFGDARAEWEPLAARRAADTGGWRIWDPGAAKLLLDTLAPMPSLSLKNVRVGSAAVGAPAESADLNLANLKHLQRTLDGLPATCCSASRGNARWQMYWFLEGTTLSNILDNHWRLLTQQGLPERALELLQKYDSLLAGAPDFEYARFSALSASATRSNNINASSLMEAAVKAEMSAGYWSQGQTYVSRASVFRGTHTIALAEAYSRDFPRRSFWPVPYAFVSGTNASGACDSVAYTVTELDVVGACLQESAEPAKQQLLAQLRGRFHGHPQANDFLRESPAPAAKVDPAARIAEMRAAIKSNPDEWSNYSSLGQMLVQHGNYAEAQRVFLSYPGFKSKASGNGIRLSNYSYEGGNAMFWRGQYELARPLYRIAAGLQTGSDASLSSAARLAQLDGEYTVAAEQYLDRAMRYNSPYAYRDYLSLLYVMGHRDEADSGFLQVAEISDNPQVWAAALVGQRMAGMRFEQLKAWALADDVRKAHYRGRRFASWYATQWMTTDRVPAAEYVKLIAQLESGVSRTIDSQGFVMRPHPLSEQGLELVAPSAFRAGKAPKLPEGTAVKSEYVLLTDALVATHAAQYSSAVDKFVALADRYPIEHGEMKVALAYFAFAAAKSGDKLDLEAFIESQPSPEQDFDVLLARAFFAASRREPQKAADALKLAFNQRPHTDSRPVMTEYQWAEACEIIGRETSDPRFERMLVEWAKQNQNLQPTQAWAYAVEAQYSKVPAEATRALGMAIYLDPESPRIAKVPAARRAAATAWLRANNPFLVEKKLPVRERVTQITERRASPAP